MFFSNCSFLYEFILVSYKVDVNMTETVELGSLKADIRETERTKCLNIPRAKVPDHKFYE